jgi:hypothetical protein
MYRHAIKEIKSNDEVKVYYFMSQSSFCTTALSYVTHMKEGKGIARVCLYVSKGIDILIYMQLIKVCYDFKSQLKEH